SPPKARPSRASLPCCTRRSWWNSATVTSMTCSRSPTRLSSPTCPRCCGRRTAITRSRPSSWPFRRRCWWTRSRSRSPTRRSTAPARSPARPMWWTSPGCAPPRGASEWPRTTSAPVPHPPASTVAAMLLSGWLASRLQWRASPLVAHGDALVGQAHGSRQDVSLRLEAAPELLVPGLERLTLETASGRTLRLARGRGGLHAHSRDARGQEHEWTIPGASRGEQGVLGEGIRQALLRDPTYVPALKAARAMVA